MKKAYWSTLSGNTLESSFSHLHFALVYKGICLDDRTTSTVHSPIPESLKLLARKVVNDLLLPKGLSKSTLSSQQQLKQWLAPHAGHSSFPGFCKTCPCHPILTYHSYSSQPLTSRSQSLAFAKAHSFTLICNMTAPNL